MTVFLCAGLFADGNASGKTKSLHPYGGEVTFTPAIGLSAAASPLNLILYTADFSAPQFNLGLQATMIGLPIENRDKWMDNFTAILNMDMGIGGRFKLKYSIEGAEDNSNIKRGVLFQMNLLAGYRFKPKDKLYITPALGLGFGAGSVSGNLSEVEKFEFKTGTFSIPLYADVKYFFTDKIGIDLNIINTFGFGKITGTFYDTSPGNLIDTFTGASSFQNTFVLKVGPVFKF